MAVPAPAPPTLLFFAAFSRHASALQWIGEQIVQTHGKIALTSPSFDHSETNYYADEMGIGLRKQFFVVDGFYDPARLADTKLLSNSWEQSCAASKSYPEPRPVNVDPGYLTLTKLVLASAKDRAHRIYLDSGIYAEECLYYLDQRWLSRPWTYPDYQRDDFQAFFTLGREFLKSKLRQNSHLK